METDRDGTRPQRRAGPETLVSLEPSTGEKKGVVQIEPPGVTVDP